MPQKGINMYKRHQIKEIYDGIYDNKLDKYQELIPYQDHLLFIFGMYPLFINIDDDSSIWFINEVVELIKMIPTNELNNLNGRLLHKNCNYEDYAFYFKMLINPKEDSKDVPTYLLNFGSLFNMEMAVMAAGVRLSQFNNLNKVMPPAYYAGLSTNNRLFIQIATACFYANRDIIDVNTIIKFFDNIDEYTRHLSLHFDNIDTDITRYIITANNMDCCRKQLELMYNNIFNTLIRIKNSNTSYQKIIK